MPVNGALMAKTIALSQFAQRLEQLLRPAVEIVLPGCVIDVAMHVGRQSHLRLLRLPGELDELVRIMIRIPHQVRVDVDQHSVASWGWCASS